MSEKKKKYFCIECGELMKPADDVVLVCTVCGHSVDIEDYGNEAEYDDYYSSIKDNTLINVPEGCIACGGPYPKCKISCKIFDN